MPSGPHEAKLNRDPVCGMPVEPADAAGHSEYRGQTYYFCGKSCLEKFRQDPARYVSSPTEMAENPTPPVTPSAPDGKGARKYTCPMHPQIVRDGPGSCPICGMALEPV